MQVPFMEVWIVHHEEYNKRLQTIVEVYHHGVYTSEELAKAAVEQVTQRTDLVWEQADYVHQIVAEIDDEHEFFITKQLLDKLPND